MHEGKDCKYGIHEKDFRKAPGFSLWYIQLMKLLLAIAKERAHIFRSRNLSFHKTRNSPQHINTNDMPAAPLLVWPSLKFSPLGFALIRKVSPFKSLNEY
jgi:hypothetical protein